MSACVPSTHLSTAQGRQSQPGAVSQFTHLRANDGSKMYERYENAVHNAWLSAPSELAGSLLRITAVHARHVSKWSLPNASHPFGCRGSGASHDETPRRDRRKSNGSGGGRRCGQTAAKPSRKAFSHQAGAAASAWLLFQGRLVFPMHCQLVPCKLNHSLKRLRTELMTHVHGGSALVIIC